MSAIDEAIKQLDKALELSRDLQRDVGRSADSAMLHQRVIGVLIGVALVGAVIIAAKVY